MDITLENQTVRRKLPCTCSQTLSSQEEEYRARELAAVSDNTLAQLKTRVLDSLVDGTRYIFTNSKWSTESFVASSTLTSLVNSATLNQFDWRKWELLAYSPSDLGDWYHWRPATNAQEESVGVDWLKILCVEYRLHKQDLPCTGQY